METNFFVKPEFNQVTPRFGNFMNDFNYYYAPVATGNFNSPINVFDQNMFHFGNFINDPKSRFQSRPTYFPNNWMKDFNSYNRCGFDVFPQFPQSHSNLSISPDLNTSKNLMKALSQSEAYSRTECKNEPSLVDTTSSSFNISSSNSFNLSNTPSFNISNTPSFNISNTPSFNISNTHSFNISNTPSFNISNTPSFNISNTPSFNISSTPSFNISSTTAAAAAASLITSKLTSLCNPTNKLDNNATNITKPFICTLCSASFSRHHHLRRHERSHLNTRPYRCTLCSSSFNDSWHLKRHQYTHTNEKPYECQLCTSAFKDSWHLKRHQQIHTKIKPFQCNECKSSFYDSWHLKRHHLQVHVKVKPYSCTSCSSKFYDSWHLKRHQQVHLRKKVIQQNCINPSFELTVNTFVP